MFSRFFIDRPIFANVIALVTILIGAVAVFVLPVAQYPEITPPTVEVTDQLPRRQRPGRRRHRRRADRAAGQRRREHAVHVVARAPTTASYNLTVTFEIGTNLNMAQVLVQNRVAIAQPHAARGGQAAGRRRSRRSRPAILMIVEPDLARRTLRQPLPEQLRHDPAPRRARRHPRRRRHHRLRPANYSMRIWLDPEKLKARDLTTEDVINAIREQNVQVAAGQIGQPPTPAGQDFQYTITTLGRLSDAEQFGRHHRQDATPTTNRGADHAGSRTSPASSWAARSTTSLVHARRQAGRGRRRSTSCPGSNALDVARRVCEPMDELKKSFPEGLDYAIAYDTTPFIDESIHEVYKTLVRGRRPGARRDPRCSSRTGGPSSSRRRRAGGDHRHVRRHGRAGLLAQQPDAVRPGAGDRHRRRRRDRGRRERGAPHRPRRAATQGRDDQGDGGGHRPGHRHHPGADGGVPADRVPQRHHRPVLPPVRPDDRRHDGHQRLQRADAQAGPVRDLPAAVARAAERVLPRLQRGLRPRRGRLHADRRASWSGRPGR